MSMDSVKVDRENRKLFLEHPDKKEVLAHLIDHTLLKPDATFDMFQKLFDEANEYHFKSVCVPPSCVSSAKSSCNTSLVCTVIGFPNGYSTTESKVYETKSALQNGADEFDFVNNLIYVKSKKWDLLKTEYTNIVAATEKKLTKLILETSFLNKDEIVKCVHLAVGAGVNIIKTSTGFGKRGASVEDIQLIQNTLNEIFGKEAPYIGIKASGGVKTYEDAVNMLQHGATRIGTSSGVAILQAQ